MEYIWSYHSLMVCDEATESGGADISQISLRWVDEMNDDSDQQDAIS